MKKSNFLRIIMLLMATSMLTLTACKKDATDYLIGQWNEAQVVITTGGETQTKKLSGSYVFNADRSLSHTYKERGKTVTDYGTWEYYENVGGLWLTYEGKETNVMHLDQINDNNMKWTDYEENQAGAMVTYVYTLYR